MVPSAWILDSGASLHICSSPKEIHSVQPNQVITTITLPDGSRAPVQAIGATHLNQSISLSCVHYVPNFKFNLLSISQLTRDSNCSVTFYPSHCILQDLSTKEEIGRGHEHAGLYYLEMTSPVCFTHSIPIFQLWHQRLGHLSVDKQRILKSSLSCGFDSSFHCNVCPLAK